MATRRIAKSAVDWAALASRVPENQQPFFRAFKNRSDTYVQRVASYPEQPPAIDFDTYKGRVAQAGLVEQFQKAYAAVKVSYPDDKLSKEIDAQEQEAIRETNAFIQESNQRIEKTKVDLKKWEELYPIHLMTEEEFILAFPEHGWGMDQKKYQTLYPHDYDPRLGTIPWEEGSGIWNFGPNRQKELKALQEGGHH